MLSEKAISPIVYPQSREGGYVLPGERPESRNGRTWFFVLLAGLGGIACYEVGNNIADWSDQTLLLATAVMFLGALPALRYLRRGAFGAIPFFEGHCLFYSLCFGYAGFRPLRGMASLTTVSEYYLQQGLLAALACLLLIYAGFYGVGARLWRGARPFSLRMPDSPAATPAFLVGELAAWFFLEILRVAGAPGVYQMTLFMRTFLFIHFMVGYYRGLLPRWASLFFWLVLAPWMLLVGSGLAGGRMFGLVLFAIWQTMAILWARRKISVGLLVAAACVIVLFQPVKALYRTQLRSTPDELGTRDRIQLLLATLDRQQSAMQTREDRREAFEEAFSRLNHLILTACVIRDTPAIEPFQQGRTYLPLLTKWIPRALWPDKPLEDLGNSWGRRYGYLGQRDFVTSLNLPWLAEMYMNYGWAGVAGIALLIGILFRWLWMKLGAAPGNTVDFSLGVTLLSRIILVESNLSLTFGDVIVGFVTLTTILLVVRSLLASLTPGEPA